MAKYVIHGGKALKGDVVIPGNKNGILPVMTASLLISEPVSLTNVPAIRDVETMGEILEGLGVSVRGIGTKEIQLNAESATAKEPNQALVADLRASILLLGPLLARFGKVTLRHPGGDLIGRRSIGQHLNGLAQMGAGIHQDGLVTTVTAKRLNGKRVYLKEASVTATENLMMAATSANGETTILNAASEPHVFCLGTMLKEMGADIEGHGTNTVIVRGGAKLHGCSHWIRPDHIEAGTWAIAAAATGGNITIHGIMAEDLLPIRAVLEDMGVEFHESSCKEHRSKKGLVCLIARAKHLVSVPCIKTGLWPSFPTDLMSPIIVLATQCAGMTLAYDWMYEGRMFFVDRLIKMGAGIILADPYRVIINGPTPLVGRETSSPDIRAGIALIIASLLASGTSEIHMAELVDRGYEHVDSRLRALGADIEKIL